MVTNQTEDDLRARLAELTAAHEALQARVAELEAGLEQERRLHRRIAELTDLVQEVLLPTPGRDDKTLASRLAQYTSRL